MAYVIDNAIITTAARTAFAADKTLMLASSAHQQNADPKWTSGSGIWSDSDVTAASFLAARAVDGLLDVPTKPAIQSPTVSAYSLLFDFTDISIGALAIIGHNFHDLAGTVTVTVQIADDSTYSVVAGRRLQIASWTIADARRLVSLSLDTHKVYTGVRYLRVIISSTTAFTTAPELGELVVGVPRIMGHRPDRPWAPRAVAGDMARFRSKAGGSVRYMRNKGGVLLRPTWTPDLGVDARGLDDSQTLRDLFADIDQGERCFLFVDEPTTTPRRAFWVELDRPDLALPELDYLQSSETLTLTEQAPFALEEEAA